MSVGSWRSCSRTWRVTRRVVYSDETPGRDLVAQARAALSADELARATEIGRQLTLAEALDLARPEAPVSA